MTNQDLSGPSEIHALLGRGTTYEGKLTFEGMARIDGNFRGEIQSDGILVIGEGAEIRGTVEVGTLIVRGGELHGNVRAKQAVELHAPGRVHGDIHTPQLFVEKGVLFAGRCTMDETETHTIED